jgi:hypothetical protein
MKIVEEDAYTIKIGGNSTENWTLLDESEGTDCYIFHLSHYPSPYVILTSKEGFFTSSQISHAASECKVNTKQKNMSNIKVDYSERSNVIKGNILGEMIWKSKRKTKIVII